MCRIRRPSGHRSRPRPDPSPARPGRAAQGCPCPTGSVRLRRTPPLATSPDPFGAKAEPPILSRTRPYPQRVEPLGAPPTSSPGGQGRFAQYGVSGGDVEQRSARYNGIMIREAIIVVLTLAAVGTSLVGVTGLHFGPWRLYDRAGYRVGCVEHRGRLRIACGRAADCPKCSKTTASHDAGCPIASSRHHGSLLPAVTMHFDFGVSFSTWLLAGWRTRYLYVPLWLVCLLFSAYPTIAFIRGPLRRYRRRKRGLCIRCGYDLTGNVSGICPECGIKVTRP
jgi:hypothetical protein